MKMYQIRRSVLSLAHQLKATGLTFSEAQKKAWAVVKLKIAMKKNEAVSFSYIKESTQEVRPAIGTLHPSIIPATKGTGKEKSPTIVTYFDKGANGWRSFKAQNICLAA